MNAADYAAQQVEEVRDDPEARLKLMAALYEPLPAQPGTHLPYRRAALAFMRWELRRGLLHPLGGTVPGSPWWRAVNERLLRDTAESRAHSLGFGGPVSSPSAAIAVEFVESPSVFTWYRAHNASIVAAYLDHRDLAATESRVERFFINLVLARVLYAHALVAAPRLAMSWMAPMARVADPRLTVTGIFMSLSRVLPDRYPLRGELAQYISNENAFGRLLDVGMIVPRIDMLYSWSAHELAIPRLASLACGGVPNYEWDSDDTEGWKQPPRTAAKALRRLLPAARSNC
jgi:hypothetical protein